MAVVPVAAHAYYSKRMRELADVFWHNGTHLTLAGILGLVTSVAYKR